MTYKEALGVVKRLPNSGHGLSSIRLFDTETILDALDIVVKSIEKQIPKEVVKSIEKKIPKEPVARSDDFGDFILVCPSCEKPITNVWGSSEYKPKYCAFEVV